MNIRITNILKYAEHKILNNFVLDIFTTKCLKRFLDAENNINN